MKLVSRSSHLAIGLILAAALAACASNRKTGSGTAPSNPAKSSKVTATPTNASSGKAKGTTGSSTVNTAKENIAPSVGMMYFPTGNANGSVISMERFSQTEVVVGQPFSYEIRVTNLTDTDLSGVTVKEQLDPNFGFTSSTPPGSKLGDQAVFNIGRLAAGEAKSVTLTGSIAKSGSITNCSSVSYDVSSCFTVSATQPSLKVTKSMSPSEGTPCDEYTARITVSNDGSGIVRGIKVSDDLPAGLTTRDGKSTVSFDIAKLEGGESKELSFPVKATKAGQFSNVANVTAEGGLSSKSAPATIVVRQPVLAVNVDCPTGASQIGKSGAFKFTVKNTGDVAVTDAVVTSTMSGANVRFVSADNNLNDASGKITWKIGVLAPGAEKVFTANYRLMSGGTVKASIRATGFCVTDVVDECTTTVAGVADIGTLLTDSQGVTLVGDAQVYTMEVENQGQVDLTDVKVIASWPTELTYLTATMAGTQPALTATSATWAIGTVKIGEKKRWTVSLKATKAGEYVINTTTTAKEIKNATSQDEVTTFVD